jgi:hypothetical protein
MRRELLYHCNKADLKKTYDRYKAKEPNSLTSQFSDRRTKEEAVCNQAQRERKITKLFPSGKSCYKSAKFVNNSIKYGEKGMGHWSYCSFHMNTYKV